MASIEKDLNPDVRIGMELPLKHGVNGFFKSTKSTLEQTKHNMKNLLLTKKGERLGNPTFGSRLLNIAFEQEGNNLESKVEEVIREAMSEWLPFVVIENISTEFSPYNRNALNVSIHFSMEVDTTLTEQLSFDISTIET